MFANSFPLSQPLKYKKRFMSPLKYSQINSDKDFWILTLVKLVKMFRSVKLQILDAKKLNLLHRSLSNTK